MNSSAFNKRCLHTFFLSAILGILFLACLSTCAYAADDITIKLEAGTKHTELAGKLADSPETWLTGSFGEQVKNVEKSGSAIVITLEDAGYTVGGIINNLDRALHQALPLYSNEGALHSEYFFDSGEETWCPGQDWSGMGALAVGLKQKKDYRDSSEFSREVENNRTKKLTAGQTFYILWDRPIESMAFTIERPNCGEKVTLETNGQGDVIPDNCPAVTCPEHINLYTYGHSLEDNVDLTYWATDFTIGYNTIRNPFEGTLQGGNKYIAAAYVGADCRQGSYMLRRGR